MDATQLDVPLHRHSLRHCSWEAQAHSDNGGQSLPSPPKIPGHLDRAFSFGKENTLKTPGINLENVTEALSELF